MSLLRYRNTAYDTLRTRHDGITKHGSYARTGRFWKRMRLSKASRTLSDARFYGLSAASRFPEVVGQLPFTPTFFFLFSLHFSGVLLLLFSTFFLTELGASLHLTFNSTSEQLKIDPYTSYTSQSRSAP